MKCRRIRLSHGSKDRILIHRDRKNPALVFVHAPASTLRMTESEVIELCNSLIDTLEEPDPSEGN